MSQSELDKVLKAPEQQLRAILRAVCDDEGVRKMAIKHYHSLQDLSPQRVPSARRKARFISACNAMSLSWRRIILLVVVITTRVRSSFFLSSLFKSSLRLVTHS